MSNAAGATAGTCTKPPSSGACLFRVGSSIGVCAPGTTCFGGACVGPGQLGEPCAAGTRSCIETLRCAAGTGTCQARGKVDEDCTTNADCEAALYCTTGAQKKCALRAAIGQPCGVDGGGTIACVTGSGCQTVTTDAGVVKACVTQAAPGEACGAPFAGCMSPLECNGGVCALRACAADAGTD